MLKRHYVEVNDEKWEVSTARLVKRVEDIDKLLDIVSLLRDEVDNITELYETMIFKIVDDERYSGRPVSIPFLVDSAPSFGFYRSNDSQDIVKAHDQIVSLIAEGKLVPIEDTEHNASVSPHIVKAMTSACQRAHLE